MPRCLLSVPPVNRWIIIIIIYYYYFHCCCCYYIQGLLFVVITLLDLKNAFGEVHHNTINWLLSYHYIPNIVQLPFANLYNGFHSSIISDCFFTPAIPFQRRVLQGDCLSPPLFNLCFNTFMKFILGFSPHDRYQ